ncbi:hypothetical protein FS837_002619 [Tulasnella sp. UAMH 9824]|nr:hypothetical protein FS837_002619 [Tulasnella sp. UAMH 9824]
MSDSTNIPVAPTQEQQPAMDTDSEPQAVQPGSGSVPPTQTPPSGLGIVLQPPSISAAHHGATHQGGTAVTVTPVPALNVNQQTAANPAPRPLTLEQEIELIRKLKVVGDQEEAVGTLSFPPNLYPRCMAARHVWPDYFKNPATAKEVYTAVQANKFFVWVYVYKTMNVTQADLELLLVGLQLAQSELLIKGFSPADYAYHPLPGPAKAILLNTQSKPAYDRLLQKKVWTVRTKTKAATFFFSPDETWGSHVVFDIHGGGSDFEKDILPRLYRTCGSAMARKPTQEAKVIFEDLAYYLVPPSEATHKGAKGTIWRVSFHPSADGNKASWKIPRNLGNTSRGVVEVRRAPMCPHCISYSHQPHFCQWWREGLVAGSKTKPKDFVDAKWTTISSASHRKLGIIANQP